MLFCKYNYYYYYFVINLCTDSTREVCCCLLAKLPMPESILHIYTMLFVNAFCGKYKKEVDGYINLPFRFNLHTDQYYDIYFLLINLTIIINCSETLKVI